MRVCKSKTIYEAAKRPTTETYVETLAVWYTNIALTLQPSFDKQHNVYTNDYVQNPSIVS